ncbi:MAG: hypothetical protein Q8930_14580, partial [Bacillota bacterium]|nr:hypothetical protein [Bacillota bacterium]
GLVNSNIVDINSIKGMGMTQIYYDIQNVVNQFSEMSPIKLSVFVIILLVYILMVAPINYIVLKKLDKRELMWLTVPLISLAFGLVVYVSGTGSRISKMTTNMVSIIHLDETGGSTVSTYAGIFSSSKSKLTVESKAGEKLMPISDGNIYSDPNQVIKNTELEAKVYDEGSGKIEYHNTSILQSKVLELQKSSVDAGTIKTELSASGTDITGKVSNNLNLDLEDCYIITPNDYYKLGDIKKGESITLGKKVTPSYFGGGINQMAMQIFNDKMQGQNGMYLNPNTSEYTEIMQKQSLVQMEFGMKAQIMQGMYFIGFSKSTTDNPLIVNGKETALHERTLVVMSVKPNFKSGDSINYPLGYVQSTVLQTGSLKSDGSGMLFGNGSAEVLYNLGPDMKAEEVSIDTNSNMYAKGLGTSYSIFNVKSNSYEVLKSEKLTIDAADLDKYLTAGNELKLKVELRDGSCAIPLAAAKGKVK